MGGRSSPPRVGGSLVALRNARQSVCRGCDDESGIVGGSGGRDQVGVRRGKVEGGRSLGGVRTRVGAGCVRVAPVSVVVKSCGDLPHEALGGVGGEWRRGLGGHCGGRGRGGLQGQGVREEGGSCACLCLGHLAGSYRNRVNGFAGGQHYHTFDEGY